MFNIQHTLFLYQNRKIKNLRFQKIENRYEQKNKQTKQKQTTGALRSTGGGTLYELAYGASANIIKRNAIVEFNFFYIKMFRTILSIEIFFVSSKKIEVKLCKKFNKTNQLQFELLRFDKVTQIY